MTSNQVAAAELRERQRHDVIEERHSRWNLEEQKRNNIAVLGEQTRSHLAQEGISRYQNRTQRKLYKENVRTNKANEHIKQFQAHETKRHNIREENVSKQNADTNRFNAFINQRNAATNERNAATNRLNAASNARNASTNARNATTNARNASVNEYNANTQRYSADLHKDEVKVKSREAAIKSKAQRSQASLNAQKIKESRTQQRYLNQASRASKIKSRNDSINAAVAVKNAETAHAKLYTDAYSNALGSIAKVAIAAS